MAKVSLTLVRKHRYQKLMPAPHPADATMSTEEPVAGKPGETVLTHWVTGFQHVADYRSGDGKYHLSIEHASSEIDGAPETIEIDVP